MEKKRSVVGIILTAVGVAVTIAGATTDIWLKGARKGFHGQQLVAVLVGLALLVVGALLCQRCAKSCAATKREGGTPQSPKP